MRTSVFAVALLLLVGACGQRAPSVGAFSNDLMGNEIKVEAVRDPALPSVVCHIAYFDRSFLDRISQGNWFENPSNSSVSCQRTGPIALRGVSTSRAGEEIFSQHLSPFFKNTAVRRIVDLDNATLIYVSHSRELVGGSAKISLSSVLLTQEEVAAARPAR